MFYRSIFVLSLFLIPAVALAQRESPQQLIETQQKDMKSLTMMDGVWRGEAWFEMGPGGRTTLTQPGNEQ